MLGTGDVYLNSFVLCTLNLRGRRLQGIMREIRNFLHKQSCQDSFYLVSFMCQAVRAGNGKNTYHEIPLITFSNELPLGSWMSALSGHGRPPTDRWMSAGALSDPQKCPLGLSSLLHTLAGTERVVTTDATCQIIEPLLFAPSEPILSPERARPQDNIVIATISLQSQKNQ